MASSEQTEADSSAKLVEAQKQLEEASKKSSEAIKKQEAAIKSKEAISKSTVGNEENRQKRITKLDEMNVKNKKIEVE